MYKFSYDDIIDDGGAAARASERQALLHSLKLLRDAVAINASPTDKYEALVFINGLWSFLLEDLAKSENYLPDELRAKLISIGFWILRETEAIGNRSSNNIQGLIEVTEMIADGLQ